MLVLHKSELGSEAFKFLGHSDLILRRGFGALPGVSDSKSMHENFVEIRGNDCGSGLKKPLLKVSIQCNNQVVSSLSSLL